MRNHDIEIAPLEQNLNLHDKMAIEESLKEMVIEELASSSERELRCIVKELGADVIPFVAQETPKDYYLQLLKSIPINLSQLDNLPRLFRYLLCQMKKQNSCKERIASLKFISSISEVSTNKALLVSYPGMLESLHVASPAEEEMEYITKSICELSKAIENKVFMTKMVQIVDNLMLILNNSNTGDGWNHISQLNSIEALMHLSETAENKTRMVNYRKGALLKIIVHIASQTSNMQSSINALRCINNLICTQTIEVLIESPNLCQTLSNVATECPFHDVANQAAKTLQKLCLLSKTGTTQNEVLIATIISMTIQSCPNNDVFSIGMQSLHNKSMSRKNIPLMTQNSKLLDLMCDTIAANDNPDKRFIASEIITHLSSHRIGARVLAKSGRLIGLLFATIYDCSNIVALRHEAMKAILNIIQDEKAALFVVDKNILPSLASFTVSNDEDDVLRRAALKVLMALIPSL